MGWRQQGSPPQVQSLCRVRLFATPWTAAHQASLSITNSWHLLKLTSIAKSISNFSLIIMKFQTELKNLQSVWTKEIKKHHIYLHAKGRNLHGGLWSRLYYWVQDSEPRSIVSEWKTLKQTERQLHLWQAARFPVLKTGLYHFTHGWQQDELLRILGKLIHNVHQWS